MTKIYLDTNVLLSYIQYWVEQNDTVTQIIDDSTLEPYIGEKVEEELTERRNVRETIYQYLLMASSQSGSGVPIEQARLDNLPHIGPNPSPTASDANHLDDLTDKFESLDPGHEVTIGDNPYEYKGTPDNQFFLREYQAETRARERDLETEYAVCREQHNEDLKDEIYNKIGNENDSIVLAQAVEWRYQHTSSQPDKVVTMDQNDMHSNESDINDAIVSEMSQWCTLNLVYPHQVV